MTIFYFELFVDLIYKMFLVREVPTPEFFLDN